MRSCMPVYMYVGVCVCVCVCVRARVCVQLTQVATRLYASLHTSLFFYYETLSEGRVSIDTRSTFRLLTCL
jgi:hypothetical protein